MQENKLFQLILKHLIDNYAYSLAFYEEQEDKCLYLEYKNVYNVADFRTECIENGIELGENALSIKVTEVQSETKSPTYAIQELHGAGENSDFFIGEILRLYLKNGQYIDIVKIDKDRWWVTVATGEYKDLCASFFVPDAKIGSCTTLNCNGVFLEIESAAFLVSTAVYRHIDQALYPSYYCKETPDDFSLEETLIKPLYVETRKARSNKMEFCSWRRIAENAYANGIDSKTIWYISNAVVRNSKKMYV